jgi:hypothetical protein
MDCLSLEVCSGLEKNSESVQRPLLLEPEHFSTFIYDCAIRKTAGAIGDLEFASAHGVEAANSFSGSFAKAATVREAVIFQNTPLSSNS